MDKEIAVLKEKQHSAENELAVLLQEVENKQALIRELKEEINELREKHYPLNDPKWWLQQLTEHKVPNLPIVQDGKDGPPLFQFLISEDSNKMQTVNWKRWFSW